MAVYSGRLVTDGNGNLLADEGDKAGFPVRYEDGQYVFVEKGEKSHNATHEKQVVDVEGTTDESGEPHHAAVQEDDAHYDPDAENKTKLQFDPDAIAAVATGHTNSYSGGE